MEAKKLESGSGEISFKGRGYHIGKIRMEWWWGEMLVEEKFKQERE